MLVFQMGIILYFLSMGKPFFYKTSPAYARELHANTSRKYLKEAQDTGDEGTVRALQALWSLLMRLREERLPPELRLFNRLMVVEEDQVDRLLQENRDLVTERLMEFVEKTEVNAREEGETEMADRMVLVLEKMREMTAE